MNPDINNVDTMNIYKPQGYGTLLSDLIKDDESVASNKSTCSKSRTQIPLNNYKIKKNRRKNNNDSDSEYNSIKDLANEVNNSLQELENIEQKKRNDKNIINDVEGDDEKEKEKEKEKEEEEEETDYLRLIIEFLLILTLYVILSQQFVVSFASEYIQHLNPTEDGSVSLTGVIIYGLILTLTFMIIRKLIFSRL